jgi:hypothetical protein
MYILIKLFGCFGDKLHIVVLIILILLISCVGFGYCLSFSYREGGEYISDFMWDTIRSES